MRRGGRCTHLARRHSEVVPGTLCSATLRMRRHVVGLVQEVRDLDIETGVVATSRSEEDGVCRECRPGPPDHGDDRRAELERREGDRLVP